MTRHSTMTCQAAEMNHAGLIRPRPQRALPASLFSPENKGVSSGAEVDNIRHVIPRSESPIMQMKQPEGCIKHKLDAIPVPKLIRPIALKVARPIPKSAVEQFYDQTYQHGIKAEQVHEATMFAQDWHRKWTQQDEEGHTMPEPEADLNPYSAVLVRKSEEDPAHNQPKSASHANSVSSNPVEDEEEPEIRSFDRYSGAKNPSPEDVEQDLYFERKRLRLNQSGSVSSLSPDSNEISKSPQEPSSKRRVVGFGGAMTSSVVQREGLIPPERTSAAPVSPGPLCPPSGLLKPTALRVHRPQPLRISKALDIIAQEQQTAHINNDHIPGDIIKTLRHQPQLSPLTLPSVSSSYRKSKAPKVDPEESDQYSPDSGGIGPIPTVVSHPSRNGKKSQSSMRSPDVDNARDGILHRLAVTGGDVVSDPEFLKHLDLLKSHYDTTKSDTRFTNDVNSTSEGTWLTLTKPTYFGNLGANDDGDPMYTLGRMAFDMFSPTRLVCSLQGNFNTVHKVSDADRAKMLDCVPKALKEEVESGDTILRTYNIVTAFTIEPHLAAWPNAPNKDVRRPIRGLMTTTGYTLPDPENPNRHSVWITGGKIEPNDDPVDQREWKRQFGKNPPKHGFGEQAKLLAVKMLMGAEIPKEMEEDGSMVYSFQRPLGGHGLAYVDTLFVDESLRIVQGHRGTIFVFSKMHDNKMNF